MLAIISSCKACPTFVIGCVPKRKLYSCICIRCEPPHTFVWHFWVAYAPFASWQWQFTHFMFLFIYCNSWAQQYLVQYMHYDKHIPSVQLSKWLHQAPVKTTEVRLECKSWQKFHAMQSIALQLVTGHCLISSRSQAATNCSDFVHPTDMQIKWIVLPWATHHAVTILLCINCKWLAKS